MECLIDTYSWLVGTSIKSESFWNSLLANIYKFSTSLDITFRDNLDF